MTIYNLTIKIDSKREEEWVKYMQETHIHDVLKTGYFKNARFCKLTGKDYEQTYSIQYICDSEVLLERYRKEDAPALMDEHNKIFRDNFVAFRSVMNVVKEF